MCQLTGRSDGLLHMTMLGTRGTVSGERPRARGSAAGQASAQVASGTSEMNICPGVWDTA